MNYKFKIGEKIKVMDGEHIPNYCGGWNRKMEHLIGKTYEIKEQRRSFFYDHNFYIIIDENGTDWWIDERGAVKVESFEFPIIIVDEVTESGRHRVTASQGDFKGIAICHPEDKFDYDFGVTLALGRLLQAKKKAKRLEELKKKKAATFAEYITTGYICW